MGNKPKKISGGRTLPVADNLRYRAPGTFENCTHQMSANDPTNLVVEHPMGHYRCACGGCWACKGKQLDCTCDIDWDAMYEANRG